MFCRSKGVQRVAIKALVACTTILLLSTWLFCAFIVVQSVLTRNFLTQLAKNLFSETPSDSIITTYYNTMFRVDVPGQLMLAINVS